MKKQSAGLLVYRWKDKAVEVLLVHPGGPFWGKKDVWSIPKGELDEEEDPAEAALREFEEEVGMKPPDSERLELGSIKQSSGKTNHIWAVEGDVDLTKFKSNTFVMEWPPKSGQQQEFPENNLAAWFSLGIAKQKLFKAQIEFIDRLAKQLVIDTETKLEATKGDAVPQTSLF